MLTKRPTGNGKVEVTFTMPALEHVTKLYLVGDFNDWSIASHPLTQATDGSWGITVPIETGRMYQFRYFDNNGHWHNDWQADLYSPNQFGGDNSVLDLSQADEPAPAPKKRATPRKKPTPAATAEAEAPKKRVVRKKKTD
jgi:1,4-alpha-glucan branching enzyme